MELYELSLSREVVEEQVRKTLTGRSGLVFAAKPKIVGSPGYSTVSITFLNDCEHPQIIQSCQRHGDILNYAL